MSTPEIKAVTPMSSWKPMSEAMKAPRDILLHLGETIPDSKDIRVGSWISNITAADIGEDISEAGGWLIWNSDCDWFIIGFDDPKAWTEIPK